MVRGVPVPSLGTLSIVSFHATKVFTTIEGGAVCFHDESFRQFLDDEKNFGIRDTEHCVSAGGNAKLNEFQAAMGLCNLRHFAEEQVLRRRVYEWYLEALPVDVTGFACGIDRTGAAVGSPVANGTKLPASTLAGARLLRPREGVDPNYAYFPLVFASQALRDQAFTELEAAGIHPRKYFYPLCSDFPHLAPFRLPASAVATPVAARLAACVLCLPLHAAMTQDDVTRICHILRKNGR